jgi:hypothetical protein
MADATGLLKALSDLQATLQQHSNSNANFVDQHSYNGLPLTAKDIANVAGSLLSKFQAVDWNRVPSQVQVDEVRLVVERAVNVIVPNVYSSVHPANSLLLTLYWVDAVLSNVLGTPDFSEVLRLPAAIQRDVSVAQRRLQSSSAGIDAIDEKLRAIQDAYSAADRLPGTLADLEQALQDVQFIRAQALGHEGSAKKSADDAESFKQAVGSAKVQAEDVLGRVHQAFRAATSQGLAKEFKDKARALEYSMYGWTFALIASLGAAIFIGSQRFPIIIAAAEKALPDNQVSWNVLLIQLLVGVLGLAGPVWLAWISTKQIGQRFRLAEDYAYKAALSSAYEGYRTEAISLDPMLQAQLFAIALTRLDEIPLRLVEQDVPGSPLHEILKSQEFRAAADAVPKFRDRVLGILSAYPKAWFGGQSSGTTTSNGDGGAQE